MSNIPVHTEKKYYIKYSNAKNTWSRAHGLNKEESLVQRIRLHMSNKNKLFINSV